MAAKPPVFIISGKSPLGDPGGYPAYAHTLSQILHELGHPVYTMAIGPKKTVAKSDFGEIHFLSTPLLNLLPVVRHLALAGLPYYSILFAREVIKTVREKNMKHIILWGMGPWAFPAFFLRFLLPKNVKMFAITSYFTSTRHEMKGALDAIRVKDYGIFPKFRYFLVYEIVARIFHIFEQTTLNLCDIVVIHYKSTEKIIKKHFSIPDKKICFFPWHTEIFTREGKENVSVKTFRHPLIVSICRQDPRKGINFIIRAMKIVSQKMPKVNCLIVGSGSFLSFNQKLVRKLALEKQIKVTGFVSDIHPILANADIAVIVPLAQGSSALTVMEAMSYGKAIIGSNCDGIPEDITNGKTGLIVKRGDEYELAKAIMRLIRNKKLRDALGRNAFSAYKTRFGFNKMKKQVEKTIAKYDK